jgi:mono/diheme cytochrome c family protein
LIGLAGAFLTDPVEKGELERFVARTKVVGPYTITDAKGVNPADNLAAILFAHRDPKTFAWHDPPLLEAPPEIVVPVDVPPWWHMKKKHAMFYVAAGRGDHARTMMAASTLCTDTIDEAREIDSYMADIYAYLLTLEAPKYPFAIDTALAEQGRVVFESSCQSCHGSYGTTESYPNLWVDVDYVGTDGVLALGASQFADRFLAWFAESFYGEVSRLEPQEGYVAPPLDGIWATAPYFHNGSVPTIEAVLDSSKRPKFWTRSFSSTDIDQDALGWIYTSLDTPAGPAYDTTAFGYANTGHTFGDALTPDERRAVIEYLKTL